MKIKTYPNLSEVVCKCCGSKIELSKRDYTRGKIRHTPDGKSAIVCPACASTIILGDNYLKSLGKDIIKIFKEKSLQVNSLPASEVKREVAHELNDLFSEVVNYLDEKFGLDEGDIYDN